MEYFNRPIPIKTWLGVLTCLLFAPTFMPQGLVIFAQGQLAPEYSAHTRQYCTCSLHPATFAQTPVSAEIALDRCKRESKFRPVSSAGILTIVALRALPPAMIIDFEEEAFLLLLRNEKRFVLSIVSRAP